MKSWVFLVSFFCMNLFCLDECGLNFLNKSLSCNSQVSQPVVINEVFIAFKLHLQYSSKLVIQMWVSYIISHLIKFLETLMGMIAKMWVIQHNDVVGQQRYSKAFWWWSSVFIILMLFMVMWEKPCVMYRAIVNILTFSVNKQLTQLWPKFIAAPINFNNGWVLQYFCIKAKISIHSN
jgi:hypothetical protein